MSFHRQAALGPAASLLVLVLVLAASARLAHARSGCDEGGGGAAVVGIAGERLASLAGRSEREVEAWVWRGGRRVAVPFQIDACGPDGRVLVGTASAPPPIARLGPRTIVLLRAADAGDPAPAGARGGSYAIDVAGSRRIYLGVAGGSLARSDEDEVDYDPGRDRVYASRYTLGFERPQVGYFSVADGKGRDRGNLIDRLKARVTARVLWGLLEFRRNESQVAERVIGHRDGALRVTRTSELRVEVGWGLPSPHFVAEDHFYADHAEAPVTIELPFSLAYVFGDLDVRIFLDFRDLGGFELYAEGLGARTIRVGEDREPSPPPGRSTWFLLRRGDTAFLHRIHLGAGLASVQPALYYVDDPTRPDPPESVPGEHPAVGYRMTGWSAVARGRHEMWMETYLLDAGADPRRAVAALEIPAPVTVTPLR